MAENIQKNIGTKESKVTIPVLIMIGVFLAIFMYGAVTSLIQGGDAWGTSAEMEWGILIAGYIYFAVGCTGICLMTTLGHRGWLVRAVFGKDSQFGQAKQYSDMGIKPVILAISFLITGFAILALEMVYPLRLAIYIPTSPNFQSAFIWMGLFYAIYLVFLILEVIAHMRNSESRASKVLGVLAVVFGVAASSNLGAVFGTMPGRAYWTVPYLPLFFIATAFLCGAAALIILSYFTEKDHDDSNIPYLSEILILFIGVVLFFNVWNIVASFIGQSPERYDALMFLLTGDLAVSFWAFEIGLGLIIPLALLILFKKSSIVKVVASAFVLIGMMFSRHNMVHAGQAILPRPDESTSHFFLSYTPTLVELSLIVGGLGVLLAVYLVVSKFVTKYTRDVSGNKAKTEKAS